MGIALSHRAAVAASSNRTAAGGGGGGAPLQAPNAPTGVTATAGNGQATVSFTPATTGGAVDVFTVTSSPGGISNTGRESPISVSGLSNGASYTFTVTASNAAGAATSGSSNSVTPTSGGRTVNVSTASALTAALNSAIPGDTIVMANGTYQGPFKTLNRPGTATNRITLTGSRSAIIDGGPQSTGYALWLDNADYWTVYGITIRNANKSIMADSSIYVTIDNCDTGNCGQESQHFRNGSSYATVKNCTIHDTGLVTSQYGEGIYFGTAYSNWGDSNSRTGGAPDVMTGCQALNNNIFNTTSESIDIKEATVDGLIDGNTFNGSGLTGENAGDSWIDLKGDGYTISNNTGTNTMINGFEVHKVATGNYGHNNVFSGNTCNVNASGYGIYVASGPTGTVVYSTNVANSAGSGLTNISVTGAGSAPSVPQNVTPTASAGQISVAFTAPSSTGGSAITSYTVTVNPVVVNAPDEVTGVSATAGNAQATVTFTPPSTGSLPTSYTVTATTGQSASGASSPITVTGLTNGTSVAFDVVANNATGSSAPVRSNTVTPTAGGTGILYPAQLLDLSYWKETLPTDTSQPGSPDEVLQPQLATFQVDPWFRLNTAKDGVQFRARTDGFHTSGSSYPRSELREMTSSGSGLAAWSSTSGTHTMTINQAVTALPDVKKQTVCGQIHDSSDDVIAILCDGNVNPIQIKCRYFGSSQATPLASSYTLGTRFTLTIAVSGGQIRVSYNGVLKLTFNTAGTGWYFKAGNYTQSHVDTVAGENPASYGEVMIYNLSVTHT